MLKLESITKNALISGIEAGQVVRIVSADLLGDRAIQYWGDQGWLIRDGSEFRLTNEGIEEVVSREAGTSLNTNGRKKPGNVDPERIQLARQFILNGGSIGQTIQQEFDID
jgi:hypothetical protein